MLRYDRTTTTFSPLGSVAFHYYFGVLRGIESHCDDKGHGFEELCVT